MPTIIVIAILAIVLIEVLSVYAAYETRRVELRTAKLQLAKQKNDMQPRTESLRRENERLCEEVEALKARLSEVGADKVCLSEGCDAPNGAHEEGTTT